MNFGAEEKGVNSLPALTGHSAPVTVTNMSVSNIPVSPEIQRTSTPQPRTHESTLPDPAINASAATPAVNTSAKSLRLNSIVWIRRKQGTFIHEAFELLVSAENFKDLGEKDQGFLIKELSQLIRRITGFELKAKDILAGTWDSVKLDRKKRKLFKRLRKAEVELGEFKEELEKLFEKLQKEKGEGFVYLSSSSADYCSSSSYSDHEISLEQDLGNLQVQGAGIFPTSLEHKDSPVSTVRTCSCHNEFVNWKEDLDAKFVVLNRWISEIVELVSSLFQRFHDVEIHHRDVASSAHQRDSPLSTKSAEQDKVEQSSM